MTRYIFTFVPALTKYLAQGESVLALLIPFDKLIWRILACCEVLRVLYGIRPGGAKKMQILCITPHGA